MSANAAIRAFLRPLLGASLQSPLSSSCAPGPLMERLQSNLRPRSLLTYSTISDPLPAKATSSSLPSSDGGPRPHHASAPHPVVGSSSSSDGTTQNSSNSSSSGNDQPISGADAEDRRSASTSSSSSSSSSFSSGARRIARLGGGGGGGFSPSGGGGGLMHGVVHVNNSANNVILTLTDLAGRVKAWTSAGSAGFRNARKSLPVAAEKAAEELAKKALRMGYGTATCRLKGVGNNKQYAVQSLHTSGLKLTRLIDVTSMPHNGCRKAKRRRV